MRFARPSRRRTTESVVPMINVVFLLLIFFMMSARIAPAPPFDLVLPTAPSEAQLQEDHTLYIGSDGTIGFRGQTGDDVWAALATFDKEARLTVRADATMAMPKLAAILGRLSGMGLATVDLAVRQP